MSKRFSEVEQWLFCATFPFILNAIAIAVALSMYQQGRIYIEMAAVTALVFAIALLLSLRALQLHRRAERRQATGEVVANDESETLLERPAAKG